MTTNGHAFVGPGFIAGAAIILGTTGVMTLYDTDSGDTTGSQSYTNYFDSTHQTSIGGNIYFQHGCYVVMSGTNPIGQVLTLINSWDGMLGPLYYSDAGVLRLARGG